MTKLREKLFLYGGGGGFGNAKIDWAGFDKGLP